jgi:hypothetical protein
MKMKRTRPREEKNAAQELLGINKAPNGNESLLLAFTVVM